MEIILINEELFRENSPIKDDTIVTKFVPYLSIAQKMYIERILGKPLTDELKDQVKAASQEGATGNEITPENQALLLILAPALSFYAVYQGIPFHWAAIVNKGITVRESENSKAVDLKDIAQLRRWLKDDAEEFGRDLVAYLCPLFSTSKVQFFESNSQPRYHPGTGHPAGKGVVRARVVGAPALDATCYRLVSGLLSSAVVQLMDGYSDATGAPRFVRVAIEPLNVGRGKEALSEITFNVVLPDGGRPSL